MPDRDAADWEALARSEPYFAVLTHDGSQGVSANAQATAEFFETGEDDIEALCSAIASVLGHDLRVTSALDFGCGAGRLTLPLARLASRVVACDIAPAMLAHARQNADRAGIHNVTFISNDELAGLTPGAFDFICSLLVFQYIPPAAGYEFLRTMMALLAPGGIAAIQLTLRQSSSALRRLARLMRARSRRPHRTATGGYDEHSVRRIVEAAGAHLLAQFPTQHGDATGAVMIIAKPRSA
jgi:2-polyprenyl-3-methyl-5-hydroxy-6-metoxy-1,4-benzoquinol methylase